MRPPYGILRSRMANNGEYKSANPKGRSTFTRVEQHDGKRALLQEWEQAPINIQVRNKEYIQDLRKRTAQVRNYILHRNDVAADPLVPKKQKPLIHDTNN